MVRLLSTRVLCHVLLLLVFVLSAGNLLGCGQGAPANTSTPAKATPGSAPSPAAGTSSLKTASPEYGIHEFLWGSPASDRDIQLAKDAGFTWIKQRFEWRYIEGKAKGAYEWNTPDHLVDTMNKAGLKVIARIDNQPKWARADNIFPATAPPDKIEDFSDYLFALASRYKGRIQAYEIWNEPNLAREWGNKQPSAAEYVNMLKEAYKAIKKADPAAIVITAGLSPTTASGAIATPDVEYLKQMYTAGAKPYFDILGVHGAGYKAPPEMSPEDVGKDPKYNHGEQDAGRIYCFRHVEDLRAVMVENGDDAKQVAVLEFGWTSDNRPNSPYAWHAVSENEKGDYLVRAFQYAKKNWSPWISVMSVIYVSDPNWTKNDEQYYWSITNPDGTLRPAYTLLKNMQK